MDKLHFAKKNSYYEKSDENTKNSPTYFEMLNELKDFQEKDSDWKRKFEDELTSTQIRVSSLENDLIELLRERQFIGKRKMNKTKVRK